MKSLADAYSRAVDGAPPNTEVLEVALVEGRHTQ